MLKNRTKPRKRRKTNVSTKDECVDERRTEPTDRPEPGREGGGEAGAGNEPVEEAEGNGQAEAEAKGAGSKEAKGNTPAKETWEATRSGMVKTWAAKRFGTVKKTGVAKRSEMAKEIGVAKISEMEKETQVAKRSGTAMESGVESWKPRMAQVPGLARGLGEEQRRGQAEAEAEAKARRGGHYPS
ncbi:hypothetical protein Micbo1qcDRAFT_195522 [Microdochium bolleyi]|uniref:Uncharacterized protein n=1 Tax=Microdochium bolleyi TaxID=196109 RepID=A0A136J2P5_9PEZI|nr:hypothetical protein Micbo1qcDRAFT_195522 [Microdochium bolleyi]